MSRKDKRTGNSSSAEGGEGAEQPDLAAGGFQSRKRRRKHLDKRLKVLYQRAMMLEGELIALEDRRFYRVCIFGSARIKPDTEAYNDVFELARYLAWEGIDVLTGGGPGLMEAANKGAKLGKDEKKTRSLSFGLPIQLEWEPQPNSHLDIKRHHYKFSSRLDDFMRLSHAIIATPGGIGTLLEVYFSWQLIQVRHMAFRPIVLMGRDYWSGLLEWMRVVPLKRGLVSPEDFDCITVVDTPDEAFEAVSKHYEVFRKEREAEELP